MKVANITLHAINNYGSVLQTYATEYMFRMLGCEVVTIDYMRKTARMGVWDILKAKNMGSTLKAKTIIAHMFFKNNDRNKQFSFFRKNHLTLSKRYYSNDELKSSLPDADIYCTGSDQTWNTVCQGEIPKAFFLDFVPEGKKKISFAASFGINELPEGDISEIKDLLNQYSAISVREQSGVDILKQQLGIASTLVLDPTLAVPSKVWNDLLAPRKYKEDYLLAYQLNRNSKFTKYMQKFAREKRLKIILIRARKEHGIHNCECLTSVSPQEWLSLIRYAKYVLTDSFHCTAYSILFHKQFIDILPPNYSDRVVNILNKTNLTNRIVTDYNDYSIGDKTIDYVHIDSWLDEERQKTISFLQNAIRPIQDEH